MSAKRPGYGYTRPAKCCVLCGAEKDEPINELLQNGETDQQRKNRNRRNELTLLNQKLRRLTTELKDAQGWHDDHCAMSCNPPWKKENQNG